MNPLNRTFLAACMLAKAHKNSNNVAALNIVLYHQQKEAYSIDRRTFWSL